MTLADIALYAYTHVAHEGGFDLGRLPRDRAWLGRVATEPGHVSDRGLSGQDLGEDAGVAARAAAARPIGLGIRGRRRGPARGGACVAGPDGGAGGRSTARHRALRRRRPGARSGELVKVFVFRGATHYLTPRDAGDYLSLRASSRMWELRSWTSYYGLAPEDWPRFREYVRNALAKGPLTRTDWRPPSAGAAATDTFAAMSSTATTPCSSRSHGRETWASVPRSDGEVTFLRLDPTRAGAACPTSTRPAPGWSRRISGRSGRRRLEQIQRVARRRGSVSSARRSPAGSTGLADRLTRVAIEREPALVLREDLDELEASRPSTAVRLLPGRDPWVMGPGTDDPHVVPQARREPVSRSANLVVARGIVAGTWTIRDGHLSTTWFGEAGSIPRAALAEECARLSSFLDRPLELSVA